MAPYNDKDALEAIYSVALKSLDSALEISNGHNVLLLAEAQAVIDAAAALGIGRVIGLLHHRYWLVRSMACEEIGDQEYMPATSRLALLLQDDNATVRSRAREAIEAIHGYRLSEDHCAQLFDSVTRTDAPTVGGASPPPRIFISYSRKDSTFAQKLIKDLKRADIRIWIDILEIGNDSATEGEIIDAIEPGIRGSDYLALILSSRANESYWVERELRIARLYQVHRNPIVVMALTIDSTAVPDALTSYSPLVRIDFSDPQLYGSSVSQIIDRVRVT
jgi:hypothetical protein